MKIWKQEEDANLDKNIVLAIQKIAKQYELSKVILFGSRAQKTNWEKSDVDLMISVKDSSLKSAFEDALESISTLLIFDVVNEKSFNYSKTLEQEIERDGVILYEK